jgi:hypothetical protein
MNSLHAPPPSLFAEHGLGDYPCIIVHVRPTPNGELISLLTMEGFAGMFVSADESRLVCDAFGVWDLSQLVGRRAFATFEGCPDFAIELTPTVKVELTEDDRLFLKELEATE